MTDAVLPFVIQASSNWGGNDGSWSLFSLDVGTPPQSFLVLPSTTNGEIWIPAPEACSSSPLSNCSLARGVGQINNQSSIGFQSSNSSTWDQIGIYGLPTEVNLYGDDDQGLYGFDSISLNSTTTLSLEGQTVAAIATPDFWLGNFGLGIQPSTFDVVSRDIPTLLSSLKAQNLTSSLSYGLSVGASYGKTLSQIATGFADHEIFAEGSSGGLVVGGYDASAFKPSNITFAANLTGDRSLSVSLRGIVMTGTLEGTQSVPIPSSKGLNVAIDSTVSHMWLPQDICDTLAQVFDLTFDNNTGLYLVNSTTHDRLTNLNPQFTFTLASDDASSMTTNIKFDYTAFDMRATYPLYNVSTPYFPIRRAANESQYVLGRAFLQEAYLIVDWERLNFTIGQSTHQNGVSKNIVPILAPKTNVTKSKSLSAGSIAGIVVGLVVAFTLAGLAILLSIRTKRKEKVSREQNKDNMAEESPNDLKADVKLMPDEAHELHGNHETGAEIMSTPLQELHGEQMKHLLMSSPVYELPGHAVEQELESLAPDPQKH